VLDHGCESGHALLQIQEKFPVKSQSETTQDLVDVAVIRYNIVINSFYINTAIL
jgi:hypothetical protein